MLFCVSHANSVCVFGVKWQVACTCTHVSRGVCCSQVGVVVLFMKDIRSTSTLHLARGAAARGRARRARAARAARAGSVSRVFVF